MGYKMVFSDMDGTLLWKGVRVSVENSAAIRKAVDKGVEFVICTGRGVFGVEKHLQELHLLGKKGYVICQNGAAVYDLRDMHLELVKKGVSKGNALAATAQEANVPLAETIAIGDSDNDLSMILQAGLGVAMKNGEAHVKAAADYITERSCEENGVAEVIEKFILK